MYSILNVIIPQIELVLRKHILKNIRTKSQLLKKTYVTVKISSPNQENDVLQDTL